jgi:hypothetical protein
MKDLKWTWVLLGIFAVMFLLLMIAPQEPAPGRPADVTYTRFKDLLREDYIEGISMRGSAIEARLKDAAPAAAREAGPVLRTLLPEFGDPDLLALIEQRGVELNVLPRPEGGVGSLLVLFLPWVIIISVWIYIMRRMMGGGMGGRMGGFGGGRDVTDYLSGSSKEEEKAGKRVTFADVAGQDNAKREVAELVEYLRDPEKYRALGAEAPHGVLLMGPPGTGKTLLARALAGEAEVAYFHISASEFIELFVGRRRQPGAAHVRRGQEAGALHHLHRRTRQRRPGQGNRLRRWQRRTRADAEPDPGGDGRIQRARGRHRAGGHQPARRPRSGAAAPGPLRPPRDARASRLGSQSEGFAGPHTQGSIGAGRRSEASCGGHSRFFGSRPEESGERGGHGGGARSQASRWRRTTSTRCATGS